MKFQRGSTGIALLFSIIELDGGGWLMPQPSCCIPVKEMWYTYERLGGPQAQFSQVWKMSLLLGCNPQTIQSVESHYN